MENQVILERLARLRGEMARRRIDFYMIPTADFHNSEYVSDYFKVREYFCNFTGSNGTLLVWREGAGLWTDGRYFIQAGRELAGTSVELFRMQEEGVPTVEEFLREHMTEGQVLGFDGRVLTAKEGRRLEKALSDRRVRIFCERDLAEEIWEERPAFPAGRITVLSERITGMSVEEKLAQVRSRLQDAGADSLFLTKLDDLMWLFNIRGCDVACNPVAMSYGYITRERQVLFLQGRALDIEAEKYFVKHNIEIRPYADVAGYLKKLPGEERVFVDPFQCSYGLFRLLSEGRQIVEGRNPTELLKAVKNPVELSHMEEIYLKDSVAVTRFIYWLKNRVGKEEITEVTAAEHLEKLRREIPEFLDLSFPTIAAYGENAAMMHYEADPESCAVLKPEGMLLVDSGGQYLGGTTDVTRTIALGPLSEGEKYHYTLTAIANLRLAGARFLYGCTGRNLDILARQPFWNLGLDYKCGTGHGVGYILNVHEGPQSIRWRFAREQQEAVIEEGMDITNEPGVYLEGKYGIRLENVMVAKRDVQNEYGQFMRFENLTWVPFDSDAIDEKILPEEDRKALAAYQRKVYEKLSPYLSEEERAWLRAETGSLDGEVEM